MVPKRHARRAAARSLFKRQIRSAFERHEAHLPEGRWLVRLKAPFAAADFVSAQSERLASAVRQELDALMASADVTRAPTVPRTPARGARPGTRPST